ncbi:MAG TPA: DUF1501 domain-containing protein [Nannocystis sp.]
MDRRKFLGIASYAGLSVAAFDGFGRPARAGSRAGYTPLSQANRRPLFITVNARGGWDPTSLCDPKGAASDVEVDAMNWSFRARDIGKTASGIPYAPLGSAERPDYFQRFFEKHDRQLLVINGVHVGTRGHDDGAAHMWSGRLAGDHPSFTALVAAMHGGEAPMGYLSFGGHDETLGECARTRSGDSRRLGGAFNPDRAEPEDETTGFALGADGSVIFASRTGAEELDLLRRYLPELDNGDNPLIRQIQVAMAAYRAGITAAVNLELDGFDTHEDHDAGQIPRLCQLLAGLDFIGEEAARQDLGDDYVVVASSEFGRSPGYNASNGKDHWPVTSVLAMGKGIRGGRVIGATTERHEALPVDPQTLAPSARGVIIEPAHIHHALRRLAGIDGHPLAQRYALDDADDMNLFG